MEVDLTEDTLLDEALFELLEALDWLLEEAVELEALLDELELLCVEALDELALTSGPTEHHALLVKLLLGNSEVWQVKLPVSVA